MKKPSLTLITGFVAICITSAPFAVNAQLTVQRPGNVVGSGSNAWSYLVLEGESYSSSQDGDDTSGFAKVYNDGAYADSYGNPILPPNSNASMQAALGTIGAGFSRFSDKVTYQMVFSIPGDYYVYMHFTMFENSPSGGNNTYLNEDSFFMPPDFNLDPQFDWVPPGTTGSDDGGYTEGFGAYGFNNILDYHGNGSRTARSTDTNYFEGNFHWNQIMVSQFLNPVTFTNADGSPRAGNPFHYVVTPAMVGVPQSFTIATREAGVTIDLFLFSTYTNLLNDYTQEELDQYLINKVQVQDPGNVVPTTSNSWSYLVMEGEDFMAKSNRNLTAGFAAVAPGSTNLDSYGTIILVTNTTASRKGALGTVGTGFSRFSDKVNYQVQFAYPGDYYMYMRFTMFENSPSGGNNTYLNEDSFFMPPDFNKDPQFDWVPPGTTGSDDGGYTEGFGAYGFNNILDYQGNGSRTQRSTDTNYFEGNFHWNQIMVSQFLNPVTFTNADGSPRAGNPFHYVVTPGMVGIPQSFTIASREPGVTPDLFLFSTHTNMMNDYTQEQLDELILQPKLYITATGGNVVVSWPTTASGYVLESTSSVSAPSWTPVPNSATIVGTRYNVTVAPTGAKYYRLRQR